MDALRTRTALEDELDPEKLYAYMDVVIGRDMGKDPQLTRGRLVFELFDDIMPRTIEQFIRMLESSSEPTYVGSAISKILPGNMCIAGDRTTKVEGSSSSSGKEVVFMSAAQEANWQVPHLNPGVLSLADAKTSKFNITFRNCEELDGWHAVFGKTVHAPRAAHPHSPTRPHVPIADASPPSTLRAATTLALRLTHTHTRARACAHRAQVYGFDVLKAISENGNDNGELKLPVTVEGGGAVQRGTHPRSVLKGLEKPKDKGDERRMMRYSSTYRHTGLIGH